MQPIIDKPISQSIAIPIEHSYSLVYMAMRSQPEFTETERKAIGKRLQALRGDLSQTEIAQRAKISQPSYQAIEAGETKSPSAKTLIQLANCFGCSVLYLMLLSDQIDGSKTTSDSKVVSMRAQSSDKEHPDKYIREVISLMEKATDVGRGFIFSEVKHAVRDLQASDRPLTKRRKS